MTQARHRCGKTCITALIVEKLADFEESMQGYYKAALSGAESIEESDAGYVKKIAGITQKDSLLSYLYQKQCHLFRQNGIRQWDATHYTCGKNVIISRQKRMQLYPASIRQDAA